MHRGLPEGNIKLVLILFLALGPSDLGPGLRLLQRVLPASGDVHRNTVLWFGSNIACFASTRVHLAYLNEVQ